MRILRIVCAVALLAVWAAEAEAGILQRFRERRQNGGGLFHRGGGGGGCGCGG